MQVGAFYTGQRVPVTGTYNFAGHMNGDKHCQPSEKDKKIPLSKGDIFPSC